MQSRHSAAAGPSSWVERTEPRNDADGRAWVYGAICLIDRERREKAALRRAVLDNRRINMARYEARTMALRGRVDRLAVGYWLAVVGVAGSVALAVWKGVM